MRKSKLIENWVYSAVCHLLPYCILLVLSAWGRTYIHIGTHACNQSSKQSTRQTVKYGDKWPSIGFKQLYLTTCWPRGNLSDTWSLPHTEDRKLFPYTYVYTRILWPTPHMLVYHTCSPTSTTYSRFRASVPYCTLQLITSFSVLEWWSGMWILIRVQHEGLLFHCCN